MTKPEPGMEPVAKTTRGKTLRGLAAAAALTVGLTAVGAAPAAAGGYQTGGQTYAGCAYKTTKLFYDAVRHYKDAEITKFCRKNPWGSYYSWIHFGLPR